MLVTDVGMATLVKELHLAKACIPILVTNVGMATLVTFVLSIPHPVHERAVMLMVPSGMAKCTPSSDSSADAAAAAAAICVICGTPGRSNLFSFSVEEEEEEGNKGGGRGEGRRREDNGFVSKNSKVVCTI